MKSPLVVILSIVALWFVWLTFTENWMFIIGAAIIILINQKELQSK
jgi:fumarate reductase subunit C|tara:strand:+ start:257 stop:394 length:138 start_codon:yes stop_codon:yes gene_type:complete